jgi:hypothetical protein
MHSIEYNLSLMDAMLDDFEGYVLSSQVFWPLAQKKRQSALFPRLTLGGLLLLIDELSAQQNLMSPEQEREYQQLQRDYDRITVKWRVAMERKTNDELGARINMWRAFLQDLEEEPDIIESLSQEVRNRVMITRLLELIGPLSEDQNEMKMIRSLDARLRDFVIPGDFTWDEALEKMYPQENFPFLYLQPRGFPVH